MTPRGCSRRWRASAVARSADADIDRRACSTSSSATPRDAIGRNAADALRNTRPDLSAAPYRGQGWLPSLAVLALGAAAAWAAPAVTAAVTGVLLAVLFLAWTGLRLLGLFTRDVPPAAAPRQPSAELPTYTVIVALYREVAVVKRLVAALDALDYPREKLQTIFVVEPDDFATRSALDDMRLGPPYEIVVAPRIGPRTKPKALNVALARARGTFTAIFDAEDRPEPDQLRRAVAEFQRQGQQLACVQARLCIDNTADGWLTRLFTAEYCGQFDVFLPGLAARALPLPLGGSSNHFRTAVLREVGGWDPYNVTEDADLGMRLARCGYRTDMIASTTLEEAPARVRPWLHQRTRWFKGWLRPVKAKTLCCHFNSLNDLIEQIDPASQRRRNINSPQFCCAARFYPSSSGKEGHHGKLFECTHPYSETQTLE